MAKEMNRYVFDCKAVGPSRGYHIELWLKRSKSRDTLKVKAVLVESKTGDRIAERTKTARNRDDAEVKKDYLVNMLFRDFWQMQGTQGKKEETSQQQQTETPFSSAFQSLTEDERMSLCPSSWRADSTRKQAMAYFKTTFLPRLDAVGLDVSPADCREIVAAMGAYARANKNYGGNQGRTENKVRVHVNDCQEMYNRMQKLRQNLPEIHLFAPNENKNIQNEQVKALPMAMQILLAATLFAALPSPLAMGALLMLLGGLRTAEACALCFEDFASFGAWEFGENDSVIGRVIYQIKDGERSESLKRKASYRIVVFIKIIYDALLIRQNHLLELGYTADEIEKMPVVSDLNDNKMFARPNELSRYIRDQLTRLGCDMGFWTAADKMMMEEPDYDEIGKALSDVTAYVLRRNFCSMLINICGMAPDLVDALMGHKLPHTCAVDWFGRLKDETFWPKVAQQMSRWVLLPEHTTHPAFSPRPISSKASFNAQEAQTRFTLIADDDVEMDIQIETVEPGDSVEIHGGDILSITASSSEVEQYQPVIGPIPKMKYYNDLICSVRDDGLGTS